MAFAGDDDFTFPASSQPLFMGSPPLWRNLAASRQNSERPEQEEADGEKSNMSLVQEIKARSSDRKENTSNDDEDEKMDMLWEDLNEAFSRKSGKISRNADASPPGRPVQARCVKAMIVLSKANGHMFSAGKKSNILVFVKIVKRAFAIHNSRRH